MTSIISAAILSFNKAYCFSLWLAKKLDEGKQKSFYKLFSAPRQEFSRVFTCFRLSQYKAILSLITDL